MSFQKYFVYNQLVIHWYLKKILQQNSRSNYFFSSSPEDDILRLQQVESKRHYKEYLQSPDIAILNEDFRKKLDVL